MRCADCDREVVLHRGRWAVLGEHDGVETYSFACRTVIRDGQVVSAHFHHVEDEPQLVFTPETSGHVPVDLTPEWLR